MERVIKFRGAFVYKNNDGTFSWICGDLRPKYIENKSIIYNHGVGFEVLSGTVGQFTGLYDKNGTEIYEDDIVHLDSWSPEYMKIAFIEGAFCLADKDGNFLGDIHYIQHAGVNQCEVVGNIYDNPELLK